MDRIEGATAASTTSPGAPARRCAVPPALSSSSPALCRISKAACYALAGRIDLARATIMELPEERRYHAAGVVFNIGHPAADAGPI